MPLYIKSLQGHRYLMHQGMVCLPLVKTYTKKLLSQTFFICVEKAFTQFFYSNTNDF